MNVVKPRRPEIRGPRVGLGYGVGLAGSLIAAAALLPFRGGLDPTDVVLVFLVIVVAAAATGGLGPGATAAVLGFFATDLLFVSPYYTLLVSKVQDLVSLAVYLLVALVVSALVGTSEQRRARAQQRELETQALYELTATLVAHGSLEATLEHAARTMRRLLGLAGCAIVLLDEDGTARLAAKDGRLPDNLPERALAVEEEGAGELVAVPMRAANRPVGVLAVVAGGPAGSGLGTAEWRMLASFATQAALAVEQARAEQARSKAHALEATDRLRRALLSSVSHDLRTPVTSILASASKLLDPNVLLGVQERQLFLLNIEQEANRLARLVGNLLEMSRIETGAIDLHPVEVSLPDVVGPVVQRVRRIPSQQIIAVDVPETLPAVLADPVRLEQVLSNVLDNARRYAGDGLVRVGGCCAGSAVELRVVDHGPGIPEEERERIFSHLHRLGGSARPGGGTGLGLPICRGLLEAMGGRIWVETAPGGGAAFVVHLPRADGAE